MKAVRINTDPPSFFRVLEIRSMILVLCLVVIVFVNRAAVALPDGVATPNSETAQRHISACWEAFENSFGSATSQTTSKECTLFWGEIDPNKKVRVKLREVFFTNPGLQNSYSITHWMENDERITATFCLYFGQDNENYYQVVLESNFSKTRAQWSSALVLAYNQLFGWLGLM